MIVCIFVQEITHFTKGLFLEVLNEMCTEITKEALDKVLYIFQSMHCLSVCLPVCLSVCLLSACLSACLFVLLTVCQHPVYLIKNVLFLFCDFYCQVHCYLQLSSEIVDDLHEQTLCEFIRETANSVLIEERNKKRYIYY